MINTYKLIILTAFCTMILALPTKAQPQLKYEFSNSDKAMAHYNIGINFAKRGDLEKAIKEFNISAEMNPDYFETFYNLGIAYAKTSEFEAAAKAYQKALELNPQDSFTYYNLGVVQSQMNKTDEAEQSYLKAVENKKDLVEAHANLAMIYFNKQDTEKYNERISIIEKIDPKVADMVKKAVKPQAQ